MSEVERLRAELAMLTRKIRRLFVLMTIKIREANSENLFDLQQASTKIGRRFASALTGLFTESAEGAVDAANKSLSRDDLFFDRTLQNYIDVIRRQQARLVSAIMQTMDMSARTAILHGVSISESVGLSASQVMSLVTYRSLLELNSLEALRAKLRDRRFDEALRTAARGQEPLTSDQITLMVKRYREGLLAFRAQTIGSDEALAIVNGANQLFWTQAVEGGLVENVVQRWVMDPDSNTRESHQLLDGSEVSLGEPFLTDSASIRFPGDPQAPRNEITRCRCILVTRPKEIS